MIDNIRFKTMRSYGRQARLQVRRFTWDDGYTFRIQNRIDGHWNTCYETDDYNDAAKKYAVFVSELVFGERGQYAETMQNDSVL